MKYVYYGAYLIKKKNFKIDSFFWKFKIIHILSGKLFSDYLIPNFSFAAWKKTKLHLSVYLTPTQKHMVSPFPLGMF